MVDSVSNPRFVNPNAPNPGQPNPAGIGAQPLAGDLAAQVTALRRDQEREKMFKKDAGGYDLKAKMHGRVAVAGSWTQALAGLLGEGASAYMGRKNEKEEKRLAKEQTDLQSNLVQAMVEAPDEESRMQVVGEAIAAGGGAAKVGIGLVSDMLKKGTTTWKLGEVYDAETGRKKKMFYNPADPSQMIDVGGQAPEDGDKPTTKARQIQELVRSGRYNEQQATELVYGANTVSQDSEGNPRLVSKVRPGGGTVAPAGQPVARPGGAVGTVQAPAATAGSAVPTAPPEAQVNSYIEQGHTPDAAKKFVQEDSNYEAQFLPGAQYGPPLGGKSVQIKSAQRLRKDKASLRKELAQNKIPNLIDAVRGADEVLAMYKDKDLPGFGGLITPMPDSMVSAEGRRTRAAIARVRNIVLAERSGAAVTDQELGRLQQEMQQNTFASDADIRAGMKVAQAYTQRLAQMYASDVLLRDVAPSVFDYYRRSTGALPGPGREPATTTQGSDGRGPQERARDVSSFFPSHN